MADLDDLIARADSLGNDDQTSPGKEPDKMPGPDAASTTTDDDARELIPLEGRICMQAATLAALIGKVFPSVRKVLTDEACEEIGNELAPLARKWKWDGPIQSFKYEAEVRALSIVAPLGFAVVQAIREDWAVMNAGPVPGDDTRPDAASTGMASAPAAGQGARPAGMIQPE